jgi:hypothetical protein
MISYGSDSLRQKFQQTKLSIAEQILEYGALFDAYLLKDHILQCKIEEKSAILTVSIEIEKNAFIYKCSCQPGVFVSLNPSMIPIDPDLCPHQMAFMLFLADYKEEDDEDFDYFDSEDENDGDFDLKPEKHVEKLFDEKTLKSNINYAYKSNEKQSWLRFQPTSFQKRNIQSKKYTQSLVDLNKYYEDANDYTIIMYFLLYSNHYFNRNLIEKTFNTFIAEFTTKNALQLISEKSNNLKMLESIDKELGIKNKEFLYILENQFNSFFLRLKNYKEGDLVTYNQKLAEMKSCPIFLPMIIIRLISILIGEDKLVTQNGSVVVRIEKILRKELYQFLPKEIQEDKFSKLIEFTFTLIFISGFIEFNNSKIGIKDQYFQFLGLTESEQIRYLQNSYLDHLKIPKSNTFIYNQTDYYYLTQYLLSYFLESKRLEKESNSAVLFKAEILLDLYKKAVNNISHYYNYKPDDYSINNEIINQIDQKIYFNRLFTSHTSNLRLNLEWIIHYNLYALGLVNCLKNSEGKEFAYRFIFPATEEKNKNNHNYENTFVCMPDFTLKAEILTIDPKKLKDILKFTKVISLDKIVNLKIYKEGIWNFLDHNKSIEDYLSELKIVCSNEIPTNVELTIRSWSRQYGSIQVIEGSVITVPEPGLIDSLLKSKQFKDISIIRLSSTIISVHKDRKQKVVSYLQKQSFHVKEITIPYAINIDDNTTSKNHK